MIATKLAFRRKCLTGLCRSAKKRGGVWGGHPNLATRVSLKGCATSRTRRSCQTISTANTQKFVLKFERYFEKSRQRWKSRLRWTSLIEP